MDTDGPQEILIAKTDVSKKNRRYLQLAKKMAECSTYGNFRHGAVLCRGSAIVGYGINSEKYSSIGAKYRPDHKGVSTYHAEIAAIMNLPRDVIKGSTIYVARVSKGSKEDRMSKPCIMCHAVLKAQGVKKVYYTIDDSVVGFYKIT
jgi:deoxycytidylate deaminase